MRIREVFEGLDAKTVLDSVKEIASFKPDYESRVEIENQFALFLQDRLGGTFIFEYASDGGSWLSKYIKEVIVVKYNNTIWIFADIPAIEELYKSDDKAGLEEFADSLANCICQEMENKHIIKESLEAFRRPNRSLKEMNFKDLQRDDVYELTKDDIREGIREQAYYYIYDDIENDNIRTEDEIYEFFKYSTDDFYLNQYARTSAKYYVDITNLYAECNENYYDNWDIDSVIPIMDEICVYTRTYYKDSKSTHSQNFTSEEDLFDYLDELLDVKEKGTADGDTRIFEIDVKPKLSLPHKHYKEYTRGGDNDYDINLYTLPEKYYPLIDDSY